MGVALENARLFDETNARAAELAIINSVQEGLAAKLDMDAMYNLVGQKMVEIFDADATDIGLIDAPHDVVQFKFGFEKPVGPLLVTEIPLVGFRRQVYETKAPVVVNHDMLDRIKESGNPLVIQGEVPKSAVFVPLFTGGQVSGVTSLQDMEREGAFSDSDVRLLSTLAASLSVALDNARLFDETTHLLAETEQRNAELAVINEIGEALAKQLDFQGIIDAVGDRIRAIFDVTSGGISLYDSRTTILSMPYSIDQGQRMFPADRPLGGLAKVVIEKRSPLRLGTNAESDALGAYVFGTDDAESWLGVPILTGDRVLGTISLERLPKNAFSESDERLLATIASNLGVALENARLFDETKRLLTETDERAAELAIINSVQEGLAAKLDMQAMYDLVGDKITEIFDVDGVDIERYDATTGIVTFEYTVERGERLPADPISLIGFRRQVVESRAAVLINRDLPARAVEAGQPATIAGELAKSALFVPMITGGAVTGIVLIENLEHEDAFSERDVRLLTTLAGSLGVALENARLFDETQRLLVETNERAAELAIINSVQEGLAAELDMQSMYDLLGNKIQEIFDAQAVDIGIFESDSGLMNFRYIFESGERLHQPVQIPLVGFRKIAMETREPFVVNERLLERAVEAGHMSVSYVGEPPKSGVWAPLVAGGKALGVVSLQNIDRENAFTPANVRLLSTLSSSLAVAIENARLFDETKRLLVETNERAAELAIINSVQEGLAAKLDMTSMYDLVGNKIQEIFDAQEVDITVYDREANLFRFVFGVERGVRYDDDPIQVIGFRRKVLETRQAMLVNRDVQQLATELGQPWVISGEPAKSALFVPLVTSDAVTGVVSLQNMDHEDAFSDGDVRLLSTLAASLSVALENARLFDETQRLLTETNERAAELAIINSIQQGLASKLDMQVDV